MKKMDILMYVSSFVFLGGSFVMFIVAFVNISIISHYVISGVLLVIFCVTNKVTEKKIRFNNSYNALQAFFFYKKCQKNGISVKVSKLKSEELTVIAGIANNYDYSKSFSEAEIKELYKNGRETSLVLENNNGGK